MTSTSCTSTRTSVLWIWTSTCHKHRIKHLLQSGIGVGMTSSTFDKHEWALTANVYQHNHKNSSLYHVKQRMHVNSHILKFKLSQSRTSAQLNVVYAVQMQAEPSNDTLGVERGFWLGSRRARGSHSGTCRTSQWRWLNVHGRAFGDVTLYSSFAPNKPDK